MKKKVDYKGIVKGILVVALIILGHFTIVVFGGASIIDFLLAAGPWLLLGALFIGWKERRVGLVILIAMAIGFLAGYVIYPLF